MAIEKIGGTDLAACIKLDFLKQALSDSNPEVRKVAEAQKLDWTDSNLLFHANYFFEDLSTTNKIELLKTVKDSADKDVLLQFVKHGLNDSDPLVRASSALNLDKIPEEFHYLAFKAIKDPEPLVSLAAIDISLRHSLFQHIPE